MTPIDRSHNALFDEAIIKMRTGPADDIEDALRRLVSDFGLKHGAYLARWLPGQGHRDPYIVATYSTDWVRHYRQGNYHRYDPVVTCGMASILPVRWSDFDLSGRRPRQLFGEAAEFGVGRHGISFPIRGRHGEQALFSITSDETASDWMRRSNVYLRDFQILAYHFHQMVLRASGIVLVPVKLAPRELECLQWTAMGKTASDVAIILGIKDRTVRYYTELARHKLDASNTAHAIAKAVSMNLFSVGV